MVRIITAQCPTCGTVVAGNLLEQHRELKCPDLHCNKTLRFTDLDENEQQHLVQHSELYSMED